LELNCPKCGYKAHLLYGTQNPYQTFSDLNEDFAYYKLYLCSVDKTFYSMNANDREWNGNCPEHRSEKLQPLNDVPKICPRCGGLLEVTEEEALEAEKEETTA
jgi:hypothetical protein